MSKILEQKEISIISAIPEDTLNIIKSFLKVERDIIPMTISNLSDLFEYSITKSNKGYIIEIIKQKEIETTDYTKHIISKSPLYLDNKIDVKNFLTLIFIQNEEEDYDNPICVEFDEILVNYFSLNLFDKHIDKYIDLIGNISRIKM